MPEPFSLSVIGLLTLKGHLTHVGGAKVAAAMIASAGAGALVATYKDEILTNVRKVLAAHNTTVQEVSPKTLKKIVDFTAQTLTEDGYDGSISPKSYANYRLQAKRAAYAELGLAA